MLRGNGGQSIFFDDKDREHFGSLVGEGVTRFEHRIHGYCWMANHVHLAIQINQVPLAKVMQNLSFRYTRWLNKRQHRIGHLFQGRYKALLVDADAYLLELIRYIHLNPVRAGLVQDPARYPWSGHAAYLGERQIEWLTTSWVFSQFAERLPAARRRYAQFIHQGLQEGYRKEFHQGTAQGRLLGDDDFIANALKQARQPLPAAISPQMIIDAVCQQRNITAVALKSADRNRRLAEARALIAYLALETGAATLTNLGSLLNRDVATLSNGMRRFREKLAENTGLQQQTNRLEKQLSHPTA
jgi:REP element-mobilizing transposase RayT